jgi:hypothetical protein
MKQPHKHRDLIIAWANGEKIQYYDEGWEDCFEDPCWDEYTEYRIKPEVIRYRVALHIDNSTYSVDTDIEETEIAMSTHFKKWITDWIEVEV